MVLQLLDIPQMQSCVAGVAMELEDCSFPLIKGIALCYPPVPCRSSAPWPLPVCCVLFATSVWRHLRGVLTTAVGQAQLWTFAAFSICHFAALAAVLLQQEGQHHCCCTLCAWCACPLAACNALRHALAPANHLPFAEVIHTADPDEAFHDCDCAILVRTKQTLSVAETSLLPMKCRK